MGRSVEMRCRRVIPVAACLVVLAGLLACTGVNVGPLPTFPEPSNPADQGPPSDNPNGGQIVLADGSPPIPISAQQLGQELAEDTQGTIQRYLRKTLDIQGVVTGWREPRGGTAKSGDTLGGLIFQVQVTDKQTGAKRPYEILISFRYLLKPDNPDTALVAVGKTVTVRGQILGSGSRNSSTVNNSVLVK